MYYRAHERCTQNEKLMQRPIIPNQQGYSQMFTDLIVWRPLIEAVCSRHDLPCHTITSSVPGTHVVFLVDGRFAIKLFSSFFDGVRSYQFEHDVYKLLAHYPTIQAPSLVAHGELFSDSDGWPYPYVVTQVIPGTPLTDLPDDQWQKHSATIAAYLGRWMRKLHSLPLDGLVSIDSNWNNFTAFVAAQKQQYMKSGFQPPRVFDHLKSSCAPLLEDLIDQSAPPCLLHADITRDHVLGKVENESWWPTGIIDFGDGRIGDPIYDFIALHLDVFRGDKRLLKIALDAYGDIPPDFARRATALTLLHEFDVLSGMAFDLQSIPDFEALSAHLWDVSLVTY
jgi:hygromycin-B 7''-O-kinase